MKATRGGIEECTIRSHWCVACLALALLLGCRGQPSTKPPVRIIGDMTSQPKALTYSTTTQRAFNGGAVTPAGAIAIEQSRGLALSTYRTRSGYLDRIPFDLDDAVLDRGKQRFNIHCSPCHDETGSGRGIIAQKGFPSPVDLAGNNAVSMADGQLFEVMRQGIRNMPAPSEQLDAHDCWSIVAWVRVLQRSRNAKLEDLGAVDIPPILAESGAP